MISGTLENDKTKSLDKAGDIRGHNSQRSDTAAADERRAGNITCDVFLQCEKDIVVHLHSSQYQYSPTGTQ
jgi:hypothetical protein